MEKSFSSELPITSAARSVWLARKRHFIHVYKLTIETTEFQIYHSKFFYC